MNQSISRKLSLMLVAVFLLQLFVSSGLLDSPVSAASAPIVYKGTVTYGASTVGDFTVNGVQAFCIEHSKKTPPTGTANDGGNIYKNAKIRTALYYGWNGVAPVYTNRAQGIVITSLILSRLYTGTATGTSLSGYSTLWNKVQNGNAPEQEYLSFSKTSVSTTISGSVQKTETIKLNADSKNAVSIKVPANVTIYNTSTSKSVTNGTMKVNGGQSFYLTAPLSYATVFKSGNLKGSIGEYQPILFITSGSSIQNLVRGGSQDPQKTISFTANFKAQTGSMAIAKTSEDNIVSGLKFRITGNGVDQTVTTGSNGSITVNNLVAGTYTVAEVSTPDRYVQPASQKVTVTAGATAKVAFKNTLQRGNAKIVKTSEDGIVEGLKFRITGNNVDQTVTTGKDGSFTVSNLLPGTYTVAEVSTPDRYVQPSSQTVTVKAGETATVTFQNTLKRGGAKIVKTSEDGIVEGLKFRITGNNVDQTVTTGKDGSFTVSNLLPGTYTVAEVSTPDRYVQPSSQTVTVKAGETATVSFQNTLKRGNAKIIKTSEDGIVEGLKFRITGDGVDQTVTTGKDGSFTVSNLLPGTYTVAEVSTPDRYVQPSSQTVTVNAGETATVTFQNTLKRGGAKIVKTSEDGIVEGLKFRITGNNVDQTVTTGKDGSFTVSNLLPGTYTVAEVSTPDRYVQPSSQNVTVKANETATVTFQNTLKRGDAKIIKTSEDGIVEGLKFQITGNNVDQTVTTGKDGSFTVSNLLPATYTVAELQTPDRYVPPTSQSVTVKAGETGTVSFRNNLKRGSLKVTKTSEDGLVEGMKFRLTGTSLSGESIDITKETDEDGVVVFDNLLISGKEPYVLEEVGTPDRYIVPQSQEVTINWNEVTEKEVYNQLKRGSLKVTKTSEDGLVEGMKFRLSGTSLSGETIDITKETDKDGVVIFDNLLISGKEPYVLEEVGTPDRYIVPQSQDVAINWNEVTEKEVYNQLKRGSLKLTKTSEDGLVEGMKFRLTGTSLSGETIDITKETDKDGVVVFDNLLISGKEPYILEEIDTQERYIVPAEQEVHINWNEVTEKEVYNQLKRGSLKVTKTSEDGLVEGMKFRLTGTSLSGETIDITKETDKDGVAVFDNLLISGKEPYVLEEVDTEERYIIPDVQDVTINWNEVTEKEVYNQLKRGSLKVKKTSEDGLVEGMKFRLYGTSLSGESIDITKETDEDGVVVFDNLLISGKEPYVLEEVDTEERYIIPDTQDVAINWNEVTEKEVYNQLKRGSLKVIKSSEDNFVEGLKFRLTGTSLSGETIDITKETDADGVVIFEDIPISGQEPYILEEVDTPDRYIVPDAQEVEVIWNERPEHDFMNFFKRGGIRLTKVNEEDYAHKLTGAVFEVYDDQGNCVGEMDESAQGEYMMDSLIYGDYTLKEIEAPIGFLPDQNDYPIEIREQDQVITMENLKGVGFVNAPAVSVTPIKTGDTSILFYLIAVCVGTAAAVFVLLSIRRKLNNKAEQKK